MLGLHRRREQSKRTLGYNLGRSRAAFGDVLLRDLDAESIQAWLVRLRVSVDTKRASLKAMRYALSPRGHAEVRGEGCRDAAGAELRGALVRVLGGGSAVASKMRKQRDRALVLFACASGLRPQEWQALQWRDVDQADGCLRVNRTV